MSLQPLCPSWRPGRPLSSASLRCGLPPFGLAADEGDRDVPHRRVGLGAMPMPFARLDVRDIADVDLLLLALGRHHAGARGPDQHLVAIMGVTDCGAALAE